MNIKHKCKMYKKIQNINKKYKIYMRIKKIDKISIQEMNFCQQQ